MSSHRLSRVLVVEDDADERELLGELLGGEGFDVVVCRTAVEALAKVEAEPFGAAIVDFCLPDMSGSLLLARLHAVDPEVRIIVYTGDSSFETLRDSLNSGAFAFVEKLADPGELLHQVQRACRENAHCYAAHLEATVARSAAELARSTREMDDVVSVVAHDLRAPLLTISGYSQILRDQCGRGDYYEVDRHIEQILDGVANLSHLIEDLLAYSRVDRARQTTARVDLRVAAERVVAGLRAAMEACGGAVEIEPLPAVRGDPRQLSLLLQHLFDNALKFRGARPLRVRFSVEAEGDHWRFAVSDNGMGIARENQTRIFELCQRLHGAEVAGTGVGLALCKKIVARHGGQIGVQSTPGEGATFYFTLPREDAPTSQAMQ